MRVKPGPRRLRDEDGAVLIVVILLMVALLGMVVLTVDVGGLLSFRRHLVTAADAASLAAAIDCAGTGSNPTGRADTLAAANVPTAQRVGALQFTPAGSCGTPSGQVTVSYKGTRDLVFAPVLGIDTADVASTASALWGPAGTGNGVPIMTKTDWLHACGVPNAPVGTECSFWLNDHDDLGGAQWSWMNLEAWDVAADHNCPAGGAHDRGDWIRNGYPDPLPLNYPDPTYVCTDTGHAAANFSDFVAIEGKMRIFPVNDPAGQVDKNGNPCPDPCTPDKYDILGWIPLQVTDVLHGNDPAAVGTAGGSGDCAKNHNFKRNDQLDLDGLTGAGCPSPLVPDTITPNPPGLLSKKGVPFTLNVDYRYDSLTHVATWLRANTSGVDIKFHWVKASVPGKCGLHAPDANGICLVTTWEGPQEGGHDPGGGEDFGLRGVRLSG